MKTLILLLFFKVQFLDFQTKETLSGVKVETTSGTYYTDFEGNVNIHEGDTIKSVSYISYKNLKEVVVKSDTTLTLINL